MVSCGVDYFGRIAGLLDGLDRSGDILFSRRPTDGCRMRIETDVDQANSGNALQRLADVASTITTGHPGNFELSNCGRTGLGMVRVVLNGWLVRHIV